MSTNAQLEQHQWKHRVILIFANDRENEHWQQQVSFARADEPAYRERDLEVYLVFTDTVQTLAGDTAQGLEPAKIREDYKVRPTEFRMILIGKDGTVKLNESRPVSNELLFETIDAMPMRQWEMREQKD